MDNPKPVDEQSEEDRLAYGEGPKPAAAATPKAKTARPAPAPRPQTLSMAGTPPPKPGDKDPSNARTEEERISEGLGAPYVQESPGGARRPEDAAPGVGPSGPPETGLKTAHEPPLPAGDTASPPLEQRAQSGKPKPGTAETPESPRAPWDGTIEAKHLIDPEPQTRTKPPAELRDRPRSLPGHRTVEILSVQPAPQGGGKLFIVGEVEGREIGALFAQEGFQHLPTLEAKQEFVARQLLSVADQEKRQGQGPPEPFDIRGFAHIKE